MRGLLLAVGLAACSDRAAVTHQVEIRGMQFVPRELVVHVGDAVVWTNADVLPHTVTGAVFASPEMASAATFTYRARDAGEYAYRCTLHPTMLGTLIVR